MENFNQGFIKNLLFRVLLPGLYVSCLLISQAKAQTYEGHIDNLNCDAINGWATNRDNANTPENVDIFIDNSLVATVLANGPRDDVRDYLQSQSNQFAYNFSFPANAWYRDGSVHTISVRHSGTATTMNGGDQSYNCPGTGCGSPNCGTTTPTDPNAGGRRVGIQGVMQNSYVSDCDASNPNRRVDWDWRQEYFDDLYYKNSIGQAIRVQGEQSKSPFFIARNPVTGTNDPFNQADMYPEDGWMLVAKDFGTVANAPVYPFFMLYNKYSGILRVLIYRAVDFTSTYQTITMNFVGQPGEKPRMLNFVDQDSSRAFLQTANRDFSQTAIASNTGNFSWMAADFSLTGYDPDRSPNAIINIEIREVDNTQFSAGGNLTINGNAQPMQNSQTNTPTSPNVTAASVKAFDPLKDFITQNGTILTGSQLKAVKLGAALAKATKTLDVVGALVDVLSFLVGGSESTQTSYNISLTGNLTLNGSLIKPDPTDYIQLSMSSNSPYCYRPVQDIPWGVIKVVGSAFSIPYYISTDYGNYFYPVTAIGIDPTVYSSLNPNPVQFSLNPALDATIEEIRYQYGGLQYANSPFSSHDDSIPLPLSQFVNRGYFIGQVPAGDPTNFNFGPYPVAFPRTVGVAFYIKPNHPTRRLNGGSQLIFKKFPAVRGPERPPLYYGGRIAATENSSRVNLPYPNPASREINIPLEKGVESQSPYSITITTIDGKDVWHKSGSIDVSTIVTWNGKSDEGSSVTPGMYLCKVVCQGLPANVHKIIIQP